jgi:hypothetical protein
MQGYTIDAKAMRMAVAFLTNITNRAMRKAEQKTEREKERSKK